MLKRFYSKRSGFTLVEIIVAFAVFSIMASMVAQILDLSIKARTKNNEFAEQLAYEEKLLTVIRKDGTQYSEAQKAGEYTLNLPDGKTITIPYQIQAADSAYTNAEQGINYFLAPVDYTLAENDHSSSSGGDEAGDNPYGGGSQASQMDTRITGTQGIEDITIYNIVKDEYEYPDDSPFKLAPGHTRYFIEVAASSTGTNSSVFQEDVPYSQYRLYFFDDELKYTTTTYEDKDGKKYNKGYYDPATICDVGHIDVPLTSVTNGLTTSNTSSGATTDVHNLYTVNQVGYSVRISTPFTTEGGKRGVRFQASKFTRFYVEFVGDPNPTKTSFGHTNTTDTDGNVIYNACPHYKEGFDSTGKPTYEVVDTSKTHPAIYGAFMPERRYVTT